MPQVVTPAAAAARVSVQQVVLQRDVAAGVGLGVDQARQHVQPGRVVHAPRRGQHVVVTDRDDPAAVHRDARPARAARGDEGAADDDEVDLAGAAHAATPPAAATPPVSMDTDSVRRAQPLAHRRDPLVRELAGEAQRDEDQERLAAAARAPMPTRRCSRSARPRLAAQPRSRTRATSASRSSGSVSVRSVCGPGRGRRARAARSRRAPSRPAATCRSPRRRPRSGRRS